MSTLPRSLSELSGTFVSKVTSLVTLPLPLLSVLALPLYGGSSTTASLVFFYATWSVLVMSHDPITLEIGGTLAIRLFCFVVPALAFLLGDCLVPSLSKSVKARGTQFLPDQLGRDKLVLVVGVSLGNVVLAIVLQAFLEQICTGAAHTRSLLRVTSLMPLPLNILTDLSKGFVIRGLVHYVVHRWLLHTYETPLKAWHLSWQHSLKFPFSVVATYDHPVCFLLADWLPTYLPAVLFRWHVLTWHMFLVIISLEQLFVFSGYAVLPSTILLAGMARRIEAHFDSVQPERQRGNYGHLGLTDFVMGTSCKGHSSTLLDDIQDEAEKRAFQERIDEAVHAAMASMNGKNEGQKSYVATDDIAADEDEAEPEALGEVDQAAGSGNTYRRRRRKGTSG
ncbi:hypothetical protein DOTSEDRAFT_119115 [Dothistroma septosporum NZE10]|uniref:Fatty acid hydroxylase domain-containing protein n=1 Tax=Dothistroma septosporum (strain NZE10 / CBS 128990) TaxID=675120 RepID=N1Q2C9_DOTSN|nr:hypothetical protein DOTSEDRAFT_119115 [Dothistroma septosporum NZE10]